MSPPGWSAAWRGRRCSADWIFPNGAERMAKARRKFGPSQKDRIFLAVLPDEATAARIHALAEKLRAANKFTGTLIRPEHLHITLFHLGDWNGLPQSIVDIASKAATEIAAAPFEIACTRTESFRNSTGV